MSSSTLAGTTYRCIVTIEGVDERLAEQVLRKDLALSEVKYTDLYIESYDDAEGTIYWFDYGSADKYAIMKFYERLMKSFEYLAESRISLKIGIEI